MITSPMNLMKRAMLPLACVVAVLAGSTAALAQSTARCNLTVKITGIRNTDGDIRVALRTSQTAVFQGQVVPIEAKSMTAKAVFHDIPAGAYGVAVIHDENKNGQLDFDSVGMPVEGYGHSNNPEKRPDEPSFEETKFNLTPGTGSIEVKLVYWP